MTMTDKEVRAIAIKEVTYADMIAIGATEEIATAASWKARCAFEASWDCALEKACEWMRENIEYWLGDYNLAEDELEDNQVHYAAMLEELRKAMEE